MQNVSFRNVGELLDFLPDQERELVDILRTIILECLPNCVEKLSYNVPYYFGHSRICFIWPASVPWGNLEQNEVLLGFCKGYLLMDEIGYLEKGNRKKVFGKTFKHKKEIDEDLLKAYLFEALELDEIHKKNKNVYPKRNEF